ncbi:hypothetical protein [Blastococcus sp. CT_GayMR19]|nr:hypothetical protein [Blastococcus sp. CT_GayMR19]
MTVPSEEPTQEPIDVLDAVLGGLGIGDLGARGSARGVERTPVRG